MIRCRLRLPNANILKRICNSRYSEFVFHAIIYSYVQHARQVSACAMHLVGKLIFINLNRAAIKTVI